MKSEQDKRTPAVLDLRGPSRFSLSNPSARIVLAILFLVSLNAVACYDSALSIFLRLGRCMRTLAVQIFLLSLSLAREISELLGRRLH